MVVNPQQPIFSSFPESSISTYHSSTDGPPEGNEPYSIAEHVEDYSLRQQDKFPRKHEGSQEEDVWIEHHAPPKDKKHESIL